MELVALCSRSGSSFRTGGFTGAAGADESRSGSELSLTLRRRLFLRLGFGALLRLRLFLRLRFGALLRLRLFLRLRFGAPLRLRLFLRLRFGTLLRLRCGLRNWRRTAESSPPRLAPVHARLHLLKPQLCCC